MQIDIVPPDPSQEGLRTIQERHCAASLWPKVDAEQLTAFNDGDEIFVRRTI